MKGTRQICVIICLSVELGIISIIWKFCGMPEVKNIEIPWNNLPVVDVIYCGSGVWLLPSWLRHGSMHMLPLCWTLATKKNLSTCDSLLTSFMCHNLFIQIYPLYFGPVNVFQKKINLVYTISPVFLLISILHYHIVLHKCSCFSIHTASSFWQAALKFW